MWCGKRVAGRKGGKGLGIGQFVVVCCCCCCLLLLVLFLDAEPNRAHNGECTATTVLIRGFNGGEERAIPQKRTKRMQKRTYANTPMRYGKRNFRFAR